MFKGKNGYLRKNPPHRNIQPDRVGIVIELKYADDGNLEKACAEVLEQIEEKKYAQGLKRWGTKKILKYGIAFYEKECMVVMALKKDRD